MGFRKALSFLLLSTLHKTVERDNLELTSYCVIFMYYGKTNVAYEELNPLLTVVILEGSEIYL